MSERIQVILQKDEAASFRAQARRESKSLSAWLRDAGKLVLKMNRNKPRLNSVKELENFFLECNRRERGTEPSWEEHKKLILNGYQEGADR